MNTTYGTQTPMQPCGPGGCGTPGVASDYFFTTATEPAAMPRGTQTQPVSPSLMPQGTQRAQQPALSPTAPITALTQPPAVTLSSTEYFNGYLRTQIGKKVKVDFLIGTNTYQDRTGTLLAVGANYIILRPTETDDQLMCDFFSIKFVTIYQ